MVMSYITKTRSKEEENIIKEEESFVIYSYKDGKG